MRGTYFLLFRVEKDTKIREMHIQPGYYIYVGSGMRSIEERVRRHIRSSQGLTKKKHWHIDYLLSSGAEIEAVYVKESESKDECTLARKLGQEYRVVKGFGSSDCSCPGHLFMLGSRAAGEPRAQGQRQ